MTRVYLPGSRAALEALRSGRWPGPHDGLAVTAPLLDALGVGEEEAEYAVTTAAAEESDEQRRIVVVAEVDDVEVVGEPGAVRVGDVRLRDVQALLVDPGPGWYAVQELDALLETYV